MRTPGRTMLHEELESWLQDKDDSYLIHKTGNRFTIEIDSPVQPIEESDNMKGATIAT